MTGAVANLIAWAIPVSAPARRWGRHRPSRAGAQDPEVLPVIVYSRLCGAATPNPLAERRATGTPMPALKVTG
jgi:hypothetical protein